MLNDEHSSATYPFIRSVSTFSIFASSSAFPDIWGQDNLIHMPAREHALLVVLVWCSEIIHSIIDVSGPGRQGALLSQVEMGC